MIRKGEIISPTGDKGKGRSKYSKPRCKGVGRPLIEKLLVEELPKKLKEIDPSEIPNLEKKVWDKAKKCESCPFGFRGKMPAILVVEKEDKSHIQDLVFISYEAWRYDSLMPTLHISSGLYCEGILCEIPYMEELHSALQYPFLGETGREVESEASVWLKGGKIRRYTVKTIPPNILEVDVKLLKEVGGLLKLVRSLFGAKGEEAALRPLKHEKFRLIIMGGWPLSGSILVSRLKEEIEKGHRVSSYELKRFKRFISEALDLNSWGEEKMLIKF